MNPSTGRLGLTLVTLYTLVNMGLDFVTAHNVHTLFPPIQAAAKADCVSSQTSVDMGFGSNGLVCIPSSPSDVLTLPYRFILAFCFAFLRQGLSIYPRLSMNDPPASASGVLGL